MSNQQSSSLSVPIRIQNCSCDFPKCGNNTVKKNTTAGGHDELQQQDVIQREMEKLSINEKNHVQRRIMGDSTTASTILERWSGEGLAEGPEFLNLKFA